MARLIGSSGARSSLPKREEIVRRYLTKRSTGFELISKALRIRP